MEDAAVIACALSMIDSPRDIELAMEVYEAVRKSRGEAVQQSAAQTRKALHLADGPEQVASLIKSLATESGAKVRNNVRGTTDGIANNGNQ